jgi:hypothetical protein
MVYNNHIEAITKDKTMIEQLTRRQREVYEMIAERDRRHPITSVLMDSRDRQIANTLVKIGLVTRGTADEGDARIKCYYV